LARETKSVYCVLDPDHARGPCVHDRRQYTPGGADAFNLGVDFKGGTVVVAKFKGDRPSEDEIRAALHDKGVGDPVIQASTDKPDEVLIKIPLVENVGEPLPETQPAPEGSPEGARRR
jgi:hypothetical protein